MVPDLMMLMLQYLLNFSLPGSNVIKWLNISNKICKNFPKFVRMFQIVLWICCSVTSGGQSIRASASALVLPMSIHDWFPLLWTGLMSLLSKWLSRVFSSTAIWKHKFFTLCLLHSPTLISVHEYWKDQNLDDLFNMLSRFVTAFLPKSKCLLISWLQSAVILESKKIKSFTVYTFPSIYLPWSDGIRCHDLRFLNVGF